MIKKIKIHPFVRELSLLRFESVFNPYSDRCSLCDQENAPEKRAEVLSALIYQAQSKGVDSIWIGRDLGYRGGRRTGLALTDDVHVDQHLARWEIKAERPTIGDAVSERTAVVIWSLLEKIQSNIFLWNVFPLHPHENNNPFSNRQHNTIERRAGEDVLKALIIILRPKRLFAIGNDAAASAARIGCSIPVVHVRHPSYGGQPQFLAQTSNEYGIRSR